MANESNEENARLNGRFIKITRQFLLDTQEGRYTPNDFLFFSAIKMIETTIHMTPMAIVNVDTLLSMVGFAKHNRNKKIVVESLENLVRGSRIHIYKDMSMEEENESIDINDILYIAIPERPDDKEEFTKFRHFEFNDIVKSGERNPAKMMLMYCRITIDIFERSDLKQTNISNETISTDCGLDKKTVTKYIKRLEEMNVLYRKLVKYKDDTNAVRVKNVYTRFDWKEYVESRYM